MKVLFYIASLGVGGAERVVSKNAIELKNRGIEVIVLADHPVDSFITQSLENAGVPIAYVYQKQVKNSFQKICRKIITPVISRNRIHDLLSKEKPDIVHYNSNAKYLHFFNVDPTRILFTFHSDVERQIKIGGYWNTKNLKKYARKGMSFIALSPKMHDDITNTFKTDKVTIIPNGIEIQRIREEAITKPELLEELCLPENTFLVGHVGRYHPVKNHEKLFRVFSEIYSRNQSARLVLIGSGNNDERERINTLISQYGIENSVIQMGERKDAQQLMAAFDVCIIPSVSESFALVAVEAQVNNVRCVLSSGIPEEVCCNSNCFRISIDASDEEWAEIAMSDSVKEHKNSLKDFDLTSTIDKTIMMYQRLMV